ncbi:hypothetical protein KUTeg_015056 [Tegillarca granosa]|uniref:Aminotransferase class V domain-containing protein n=1 Tax=Tegillarca granosa TaxID=220873 RepID=A0ABQ9ETR3_TEGGR|nr:hypothetical protein KUTeg_015056 [Tegillarca granosa]
MTLKVVNVILNIAKEIKLDLKTNKISYSKESGFHGDQMTDRKGCFCYLLDNHTSVQGMRELVVEKAGSILCLDEQEQNSDVTMATDVFKHKEYRHGGNCLFVYPAQSNFSGRKYPLQWIKMVHNNEMTFQGQHQGHWYVGLDAAAFVCTSKLDLDLYSPDFVTLSFYKMFGIPTGLGALLVRNESAVVLKKKYFGGGAVSVSSAKEMFHVLRPSLSDG